MLKIDCGYDLSNFYARQQNASRVLAIVWASVCLSVTLWHCIKTTTPRITKSLLLAITRNLVLWQNFVSLGERFSSNEDVKEGYKEGYPFFKKTVILLLFARLVWKRLQIGTYMLHIIAITGDRLFRFVNIDDFEWPWTPKRGVLVNFSWFWSTTHILGANSTEMAGDRQRQPPHKIFSIKRKFR